VLCTSEERMAKDRAIREKQEQRFLADLHRLQQRIDKGRLKRQIFHRPADVPLDTSRLSRVFPDLECPGVEDALASSIC